MPKKVITIRLDKDLWVKLRRMQEKGEIKSIQEAATKGFEWIIRSNHTKNY